MTSPALYPHGPELGPICLGAATFGREIDQTAAFALMDHARVRGVTLFDTAANYSRGASESIVGAWLASRQPAPESLTIATKIYPPYTPEAISAAVTASVARLGQATLDVLYLHIWDQAVETPATLIALDQLLKSNRVRVLGASNFTSDRLATVLQLQAKLGLRPFRLIQNNHNLAVQEVDAPLCQLCATHGVAIVTYSPLGGGFLTGKHQYGVQPGSRFDVSPGHQDVYFNPLSYERLARLQAISQRIGEPMPRLALSWALHQPGISSVLIGGRTPNHLDQAFDALAYADPTILAELNFL